MSFISTQRYTICCCYPNDRGLWAKWCRCIGCNAVRLWTPSWNLSSGSSITKIVTWHDRINLLITLKISAKTWRIVSNSMTIVKSKTSRSLVSTAGFNNLPTSVNPNLEGYAVAVAGELESSSFDIKKKHLKFMNIHEACILSRLLDVVKVSDIWCINNV